MATMNPRGTTDEDWKPLVANRYYAARLDHDDGLFLRFGPFQGIYIVVNPASVGALVNTLDFGTGDQTAIGKLSSGDPITIGRVSQSTIKIMHAIISRQHLELSIHDNIVLLKDLGSTNGTFIHKSVIYFDVDAYIAAHPLSQAQESTMDSIHEQFGSHLDDFLQKYVQRKGSQPQ